MIRWKIELQPGISSGDVGLFTSTLILSSCSLSLFSGWGQHTFIRCGDSTSLKFLIEHQHGLSPVYDVLCWLDSPLRFSTIPSLALPISSITERKPCHRKLLCGANTLPNCLWISGRGRMRGASKAVDQHLSLSFVTPSFCSCSRPLWTLQQDM